MRLQADRSAEGRATIVLALLRRQEPASVLAKQHGISENTVGRWCDEFVAPDTERLASGMKPRWAEAQRLIWYESARAERDWMYDEFTI